MIWEKISDMLVRLEALTAGFAECRGLFRILDADGAPLGGVQVSYKVGESEWIPCGSSHAEYRSLWNYIQPSSVFYRIGDPVSWRFLKTGYEQKVITRYTADKKFDERFNSVVLHPVKDMRLGIGETLSVEDGDSA